MADSRPVPKLFWFSIIFAFFMAVGAAVVIQWAKSSTSNLPPIKQAPEFNVETHRGTQISDEDMPGTLWIVDFIFTRCENACPVMTSQMAELYQAFEHSDKLRFLSFTVDPEYDMLDVLRAYANAHGVTDNRWLFARTSVEEVVRISEKGFLLPADNLPMGHSTKFALVDHTGAIRGYYDAMSELEMDQLVGHIRVLGKEMR